MSIKEELEKEWNLKELKKLASEFKIPNRSKMNKKELIESIHITYERV